MPGCTSPSMTYSALAMARSLIVRHCTSSTGFLRVAPAACNSSYPSGVVGGSKQDAISIAGSTPMLTEASFRLEIALWIIQVYKYIKKYSKNPYRPYASAHKSRQKNDRSPYHYLKPVIIFLFFCLFIFYRFTDVSCLNLSGKSSWTFLPEFLKDSYNIIIHDKYHK